ncbi:MAG: hypothetical protein Q8R55_07680 [Candidatus Taylorbacteria bacterium]|nr:hypothetical protein [Candidatus Taylorbacteria bacterium]
MLTSFIQFLKNDRLARLLLVSFFVFVSWWLWLSFMVSEAPELNRVIWANSYQIFAVIGSVYGLVIARRWGSFGSVMGRAIMMFSIGLLFQVFGQNVFGYYSVFSGIEIPYPSLADVGFFGSIPFYIYGIVLLGRASGVSVSLRSFVNQIQAVAIPMVGLVLSYWFFLQDYGFDWSQPLKIFFDFAYPLGQAAYVTLALATFFLSRKVLGGIMKGKILFIFLALFIQYVADYNFLYQANNQTFGVGNYGDGLYMLAYFVMALGLVQLDVRYISPRLGPETKASIGERLWQQLDQVATLIVQGQAAIMGPLAWNEAEQVSGIAVDVERNRVYLVESNSRVVLENLVARYERLFGQASREVNRDSVRKMISQVPQEEIPDALK